MGCIGGWVVFLFFFLFDLSSPSFLDFQFLSLAGLELGFCDLVREAWLRLNFCFVVMAGSFRMNPVLINNKGHGLGCFCWILAVR